jgi:hypothetical protein
VTLTPLGKAVLAAAGAGVLWLAFGPRLVEAIAQVGRSFRLGPVDWMVLIALAFILARVALLKSSGSRSRAAARRTRIDH